ncbi:MAG: hypothetical protein IMHGJWDQ_000109 [Candidatus Fervidibacter sp.]
MSTLALGYLFHPALFTMLLFDFHPVLMAVPFLLWAMDAADKGNAHLRPYLGGVEGIPPRAQKHEAVPTTAA